MAERLSIEHFVGECALKCSQVILAARIPRPAGSNAPSDKRSGRWFLLEVEDVPGLPTQLEPWRRDITQPLVLEVFVTGGAGGDKLLERWTLHYGPSSQPGATSSSSSSVSRAGTSDDAAVYKRMILLVRSLHSYVRVLPSYRLFRAVKRQPAQPLGLAYRLTAQAQDGTTTLLGGSAPAPQATTQGLRGAFAFSPVETPGGLTMRVGVEYAPAGVAHMLLEATAAPVPASSAPRIIPDYVGGSGAPGERASVAAMAGGSSAGGSPACAHSAPGGRLLGSGGVPVPLGPLAGASPLGGAGPPLLAGSVGSGGASGAAFSGSPLQLPRAASLRPAPVVRQSWGSREVPAHVVHRGFATTSGTGPASPASRHRRSSSGSGPTAPAQPWGPGSAGAGASALGTSPATSLHHAPHAAAGRPPLPVPHSPISGAAGGGPSSASPTTPLSLPRPSPLQRSSSGGGPALFVASSPPTPQHAARGSAVGALGTSAPAHAGLPPSGHRTPHGASPHQSPHQLAPGRTRHTMHAHVLPRPLPAPTAPRPPAAPAAIMQGFEPRPAAPQSLEQQQQQPVPSGSAPIAVPPGQEGAAGVDAPTLDSSAGGLSTSRGDASDTAPQQGTTPSAPVAIPGRGNPSRGRARSVTDLTALGDAAAGAGGLSCAMRTGTGAAAAGDGSSSAGAGGIGAASTTSVDGAGPAAGLLHRTGHLAMAPSSAPAAPRGMLGQLLAQGASSPLATCGALDRVGALQRGSLLPGPITDAASSGSDAAAGADSSADMSASQGEEEAAAAGAVMCPTAAVIVRPHAGPPFHRLSQVSAAGSRSPTGLPHPQPRQPRRIRSGECGVGGDGSGPGSPMAAGPLSASPSLPFAFTPSGASVRSLVEQHRWGGGGVGPTPLPHVSLAVPLPGLPGPSQLLPAQLPSPSPPVSGRDITALATIRRPSWSGRSVTLCAAAAVAVVSASPSPRADPGDSGGGSERSLHLAAGLSVSPGGGEDLLAGALESDGGAVITDAPIATADSSCSAAAAAAGGESGGPGTGSGTEGHAADASHAPTQASQGAGAGYFGPEESEGDALPFALDSDTPLAIGGLVAAGPVRHAGRLAGGPGSQGGPTAGAVLGSSPSRARDLSVCAFIRTMQDAPPLCSHWGWGGDAATVGDALLQVEQLAARLQPVLLQPPQ